MAILPLPFVLSHYTLTENYGTLMYIVKHLSIITLLFLLKLIHLGLAENKRFKPYFFVSFTVFILYLIINYISKSELTLTKSLYIASFLVLFYTSFLFSRLPECWNYLRPSYYSLLIVLFVTILISYLGGLDLYEYYAVLDSGQDRKRWLFGYFHPGYFASFLLTVGVLGFNLIRHNLIAKTHYIVVFTAAFLIFLSGTRNSLITYFIVLFVSHSTRAFRLSKLLVLAGTLVSVLMLNNNWILLNRLSSGRLGTWVTHLALNSQDFNFLWGTGLGNAKRIEFKANGSGSGEQELLFHIDNFYFEVLLQFGIIGLGLLFLVIISLFIIVQRSRLAGFTRRFAYSLLIGLMFYGSFDSAFISTGNLVSVFFWLMFFTNLNMSKANDLVFK